MTNYDTASYGGERKEKARLESILQSQDPSEVVFDDSGRRIAVPLPDVGELQVPTGPYGG
jgi:hypothetical protein